MTNKRQLSVRQTFSTQRKAILSAMIKHFAAPDADDDVLVRQQLGTAIALIEVGLADESQSLQDIGHRFGAWLKIAINQKSDLFVEDMEAVQRMDELAANFDNIFSEDSEGKPTVRCLLTAAKEMLEPALSKPVCVLFIGDCLLWDASLQLQILARAHNVIVEPTIMAQRVGSDLRSELAKQKENAFDFVIYSPFSYEFSGEYVFASAPGTVFWALRKASRMLNGALADVAKTVETLAARFECPIYVHTVSGVQQSRPGWRGSLKRIASLPGRNWARQKLNNGLSSIIFELNAKRDWPIARIDELAAGAGADSVAELGCIAYNAGELHPTRLAMELARGPYLRAARVAAQLASKKLIVCDLDNTLWDGVIGEGAVRHHHDRQEALLLLKTRGVVLAVASKNDPENVVWDQAKLSGSDFIAQRINWRPKAANIRALAEELNLKPSSFVFLDDRSDERAMASEAMPGLIALDPNEAETWAMLRLWAETSQRSEVQDRTRMYQERTERAEFLNSIALQSAETAAAYQSLGLHLSLRHPTEREMPRVVELINRTNQFNTTAARTSRQEMEAGRNNHRILIADARDKFGDMGIVGVIVTELGHPWRITHFVLSCRVFGYGIEDAMLNAVKRWRGDTVKINAELIETPFNGPCRDVYQRNGFFYEDNAWKFEGPCTHAEPSWLKIDNQTNISATLASAVE